MAAAWVVIVAGIVFILATVFFAGAMVVGFNHHCNYRDHMMYQPGGPGGPWGAGPWQFVGPAGPGNGPPGGPPPGSSPGGPSGPQPDVGQVGEGGWGD